MRLFLVLVVLLPLMTSAQPSGGGNETEGYFAVPLDRAIYLSGTFGELRPGHFHAGIDIKSINGRPGEKVLSSAGGYVARIKVSPYGYGNALYIAHPNGYTTVYAHLDKFIPEIAEYIKKKQYELKRFAVDLYPRADQFTFAKGEHIGYLGNSGGSYGPHLHFEIRRTADQVPINPLQHGIPVKDSRKPVIEAIMVYYMDADNKPIHSETYRTIEVSPGIYTLQDTLREGAWRIGIGVSTIDRMDQVSNKNGVFSIDLEVDGSAQFAFKMEELSFSRTRYLNAHTDYAAKKATGKYFNICFPQEGNKLTFYDQRNEKGIIELFSGKPRSITIEVSDVAGNTSTVKFEAIRDTAMWTPPNLNAKYTGGPNDVTEIREQGFEMQIPKGAFYKTQQLTSSSRDTVIDFQTKVHRAGDEYIPLHKYGEVSISLGGTPPALQKYICIGYLDEKANKPEIVSLGGKATTDKITADTRAMGSFVLISDTIPPTITPIEFSENMSDKRRMRFKIEDNLATSGKAKGLRYEGSCDGKWILFEYDAKRDMLTHWFDSRIGPGEHEIVLKVTDDRGNSSVLKRQFSR